MKCNVGTVDSLIRIIIGIGILFTGIALKNFWGIIGLIPLITGFSRRCLLYIPMGISTIIDKNDPEI